MNNQEAFNRSVAFLLKQKAGAMSNDGGAYCQYLTSDGRRCGIGALLDLSQEELFDLNHCSGWTDVISAADSEPGRRTIWEVEAARKAVAQLEDCNQAFLCSLQLAHDQAADLRVDFLAEYIPRARAVAEAWGLDASVLDNAEP